MDLKQELIDNNLWSTTKLTTILSAAFYGHQAQEPDQFAFANNNTTETSLPSSATVDGTCKDSNPFTMIATQMQDVTKEGGIKKMVWYEGYGPVLQDNAMVSIWYEAYLEYDDVPFDSTVVKWKPYTFSLGKEVAVATLSLAVQTMRLREESWFLIQPIYVFGTRGLLKPVPPHSAVLLKITVKNAMKLSSQNQEFRDVYNYAHILSSRAEKLCKLQIYSQAIKEYSAAVNWLEIVKTKDWVEQNKQQQLLLRLLTNLVILHTKLEEPRRACTNANKIYNLCKTALLKIPVKALFNHARCLILLLNFNAARRRLEEAQKVEPHNEIITKELTKLEEKRKEIHSKEMVVRKAPIAEVCKLREPEISREFKKAVTQYCEELLNDDDCSLQYKLPGRLTQKELEFSEQEMQKYGFVIKHSKRNGIDNYFILKTPNVAKY